MEIAFVCMLCLIILGHREAEATTARIKESVCHLSERRSDVLKWKILCSLHETIDPDFVDTCAPGTSLRDCLRGKFKLRRRKKRQEARPVVGSPCTENIDCQTFDGGSTCTSAKRCACLSGFVSLNGFCWRRINPGQSGCTYTAQCEASWPGTVCSSGGVCLCANNQPPHQTKDGPVCVLDGQCPTNGPYGKLIDSNGNERQCNGDDSNCMNTLLYDCICNPGAVGAAACQGRVSYCCPSRAWACSMPYDQGSFGGVILPSTRYYFNGLAGRCEAFVYRGSGGNSNNFLSQTQCDSYCGSLCARGSPGYTRLLTGQYIRRACSSSSRDCGRGFGCQADTLCCPTRANICGTNGGVLYPPPAMAPTGPDPGQTAPGLRAVTRFYFDSNTATCRQFAYNGIGGNFNNFATDVQCRQFCSRTICEVGDPLRDSSGNAQKCGTESAEECPSKYTCNDEYCCPTADFVCRLSRQVGSSTCSSYATRYYYNPDIGDCASFTYSGCQGNMNNFNSYDACMTFCQNVEPEPSCPLGKAARDTDGDYILCGRVSSLTGLEQTCPLNYYCLREEAVCCPTAVQTCLIDQSDAGTTCVSSNRLNRWYYNVISRVCESFRYNGCDGNSNNFATRLECEDYCRFTGCPDHGLPYVENARLRSCVAVGSTGYDCPDNYVCSAIQVPLSNSNNRGYYCCPNRVHTCSQSMDQGTLCGTNTVTRYYYNSRRKRCDSFTYNGCGGNDNNFPDSSSCQTFCESAGCPFGQIAMKGQSSNGGEISCDTNEIGWSTCSNNNGICAESTFLNSTLCCGSNAPAGLCPPGQRAYVDSMTNRPMQCTPNLDSCPAGYSCNYDAETRSSYCCGVPFTPCPDGSELLIEPVVYLGQPQARQCTPDVQGSCPSSYECEPITITVGNVQSTTGHCCSMENPCGSGYTPYRVGNEPVSCNTSSSTCPAPYECLRKYCCAIASTLTNVCAVGKQALYRNGAPTLCVPSSTFAPCPNSYTCDLYTPSNVYYCCGNQTARTTTTTAVVIRTTATPSGSNETRGGCPSGFRPVTPLTYCSPNGFSQGCPEESFCTYDPERARFICCSTGNATITNVTTTLRPPVQLVCPRGRIPAVDQSMRPMTCSETNRCPRGYSCVYTPNGDYCCSMVVDAICPGQTRPYMYTYSNTPLACLPNSGPRCPNGYQCQRNLVTRTSFICCTGAPLAVPVQVPRVNTSADGCPRNSRAYIYTPTKSPLVCVPNGSTCPTGYACTASIISSDYRCCSVSSTTTLTTKSASTGNASTARSTPSPVSAARQLPSAQNVTGCPEASEPYLFPNSALPLACDPKGPPCPKNYKCVQSNEYNGTMICCRSASASAAAAGAAVLVAPPATTHRSLTVYSADEIEVEIELASGAFAGEPCTNDEECRHGAGSKATCRNGFCICASNEVNLLGICTRSGCPAPYRNVAGKCVLASPMQFMQSAGKLDKPWPPRGDLRV